MCLEIQNFVWQKTKKLCILFSHGILPRPGKNNTRAGRCMNACMHRSHGSVSQTAKKENNIKDSQYSFFLFVLFCVNKKKKSSPEFLSISFDSFENCRTYKPKIEWIKAFFFASTKYSEMKKRQRTSKRKRERRWEPKRTKQYVKCMWYFVCVCVEWAVQKNKKQNTQTINLPAGNRRSQKC